MLHYMDVVNSCLHTYTATARVEDNVVTDGI